MLNEKSDTMEWLKVSDAGMRIEAVISGQAVVIATGEPVPVQPVSMRIPVSHSNFTPIPHTVVVLKRHQSARKHCPEKRARRVGRISRQFMNTDDEESDCCTLWCWRGHRSASVNTGPLIRC